jgi:hypothetical protein
MKTFTPYAEGSGFTQLDNSLIDYVMPVVEPPAWVIICFIIRKTRGWHKESDDISLSQICDGTGLARPTAVKWVSFLESNGHILVGRGDRGTTNKLRLNPDFVIDPTAEKAKTKRGGARIKGLTSSNNELSTSSNNELPPSSNFEHTKETDSLKEKGKKAPPPVPKLAPHQANALARENRYSPTTPKAIKALCEALEEVTQSLNTAKVEETAYTLYGYEVTPSEVLTLYGGSNCYWRRVDWRGQKGNRPELGNITGTIIAAREWLTNGGAAETEKATEAAQLYRQWIQPLAGMNGTAREYFKAAPSQVKRVLSANGMGNIDQIKRVSEADFAGWYAGVK